MAYTHHEWRHAARDRMRMLGIVSPTEEQIASLAVYLQGVHALGRAEGAQACRAACIGEQLGDAEIAEKFIGDDNVLAAAVSDVSQIP